MKTIIAFFVLLSLPLFAAAEVEKVKLTVETRDGTTKIRGYQYRNAWGRREIRLEATTLPIIGKLNPTLGYGRDTDDDEKIDTWFMIDSEHGMVKYITGNEDTWGHRALIKKVFKRYESSIGAHLSAAYGAIFGTVLMSISHGWEAQRIFWIEWMDLEEFALRLNRAKNDGMITLAQYDQGRELLIHGYQETVDRLGKAVKKEYWVLGGVDIALWASGGIAIKWLGKGLAFVGKSLAPKALLEQTRVAVGKMMGKVSAHAKAQLGKLRGASKAVPGVMLALTFKKKFTSQMGSMMFKHALTRSAYLRLSKAELAVVKAMREWKYIAFMAGIQLTAETFANASEVVHPNPAITAQNVLTNNSIMQNIGFMSRNAFLMTAATYGIENKKTRFATCGFIALGHSAITNLWLNKDENPDYARVALDTGWEATIGNAQVQVDLAALSYFEKLSVAKANPRLKLLGWAVVLVEQAAGFTGYSLATQSLEDRKNGKASVHLVPVLVED